jgi:hypothetical protein
MTFKEKYLVASAEVLRWNEQTVWNSVFSSGTEDMRNQVFIQITTYNTNPGLINATNLKNSLDSGDGLENVEVTHIKKVLRDLHHWLEVKEKKDEANRLNYAKHKSTDTEKKRKNGELHRHNVLKKHRDLPSAEALQIVKVQMNISLEEFTASVRREVDQSQFDAVNENGMWERLLAFRVLVLDWVDNKCNGR